MLAFRSIVALGLSGVILSACLVEIRALQQGQGGQSSAANADSSAQSGPGGGAATSGAGGSGGDTGPCPGDMVHVTDPDFPLADFCIDRLEVTQKQFAAFVVAMQDDVANAEQPPVCATNETLGQIGDFCPNNMQHPNEPVNCVDWCDAWAYCAWRGKRLCGRLPGGEGLAYDDPGQGDEWEFACTGGLKQDFAYGASEDLCACYFPKDWVENDPDMCGLSSVPSYNRHADVGTHPGCEGGFPGLFDMLGNIAEWTNRCESDAPDANCMTRGGYPFGTAGYDDCRRRARDWPRIDNLSGSAQGVYHVGIRCCADPSP